MADGVDGYLNKLTTVRDETGQTSGSRSAGLDGQSRTVGVFLAADIPLAESWALQPGLRYDHFTSEDNRSDSGVDNKKSTDEALSPSVALLWDAADWLTLVASYNQAFRAPSMEEMYSTGTHYDMGFVQNTFVPNPDLKPEKAKNKELSARLKFDQLIGDDELAVTGSVFRNDVDNFISQYTYDPQTFFGTPFDTKTSWKNVDEAVLKGFEVSGKYRYQSIETGLSYGQTRGEDKKTGVALDNIPADKWVADLGVKLAQDSIKLGGRYSHIKAQNRVDPENTQTSYEGYNLVDLYMTYEPASGQLKGFKADFTINNITDKYYRVAWQELYMPGRSYKLNLRYSF